MSTNASIDISDMLGARGLVEGLDACVGQLAVQASVNIDGIKC